MSKEQIGELYIELGGLKEQIVELIEDNTRLVMENERLQEKEEARVLASNRDQTRAGNKNQAKEDVRQDHHLVDLYDEGFHICNVHSGGIAVKRNACFALPSQ